MTALTGKKQYNWIDALKALSILCIYITHADGVGRIGLFAMRIAIPCFFFASGFLAKHSFELTFLTFVKKKAATLFIPYVAFTVVTIAVKVLLQEQNLGYIINATRGALLGMRNSVPVVGLWFLPCLFFMSLYYYILKRFVKRPFLIIAICLFASAFVKLVHEAPYLPLGIDMAARFIIYFCLGDILRNILDNKTLTDRILRLPLLLKVLAGLVVALCFYLFYAYFYFDLGYFFSLLQFTPSYAITSLEQFIYDIVIIIVMCIISIPLGRFEVLRNIGRVTLVLVGVESIVKTILPPLLTSIGLAFPAVHTPIETVMVSIVYIAVAYFVFALPINRYLPEILGRTKLS